MGQLPKFKTENEDLNWDEVSVLYVSYETGLVALPDTKPGDLSFTFLQSSFTSVSKLNILFLKIRKKMLWKCCNYLSKLSVLTENLLQNSHPLIYQFSQFHCAFLQIFEPHSTLSHFFYCQSYWHSCLCCFQQHILSLIEDHPVN